jgi:hypothetical protein
MSDENVIFLSDFRPPEGGAGAPCRLTFYGAAFLNEHGDHQTLRATTVLPDGDWKGALDRARADGGVFHSSQGTAWVLPWPFAAVEIQVLPASR